MAVTETYLAKFRRAVRRIKSTDTDAELTELIEECRADLISVGVFADKVNDETDPLVLGAVKCFVRGRFGLSNEEADKNLEYYAGYKDELRKKTGYMNEEEEVE